MTTDRLEFHCSSAADTDLSMPAPAEAELAKKTVANAWSVRHIEPAVYRMPSSYPTRDEVHDIDSKDLDAWKMFEDSLAKHISVAYPRWCGGAELSDLGRRYAPPYIESSCSVENAEKDVRRRRYAELSCFLDEWANDPSDFDERVEALVEEALRETAPRYYRDE